MECSQVFRCIRKKKLGEMAVCQTAFCKWLPLLLVAGGRCFEGGGKQRHRLQHYTEPMCAFGLELPTDSSHKGFYCAFQQSKRISVLLKKGKSEKSLNSVQPLDSTNVKPRDALVLFAS